MTEPNDWNAQVIREFRERGGKVGGAFEGATLLLLHTTGAKSGAERVNPLMYQQLDSGLAVFASKGGAPDNPDWYYNVRTHPEVKAEIGTEERTFRAREATGQERARIWEKQKAAYPQFAEYERQADREIPVVVLEPAD